MTHDWRSGQHAAVIGHKFKTFQSANPISGIFQQINLVQKFKEMYVLMTVKGFWHNEHRKYNHPRGNSR